MIVLSTLFGTFFGVMLAQIGAVDVDPTTAGGLGALASVHLHTILQTRSIKRDTTEKLKAHVREFHPPEWVERAEFLEREAKTRELTAAEVEELESLKMRAVGAMRGEPYEKESAERLEVEKAAEVEADVRGFFGFIRSLLSLFVRR